MPYNNISKENLLIIFLANRLIVIVPDASILFSGNYLATSLLKFSSFWFLLSFDLLLLASILASNGSSFTTKKHVFFLEELRLN